MSRVALGIAAASEMTNEDWLDRFFDAYYEANPVNATFIGRHDHDDRLPDGAPVAVSEPPADGASLDIDLARRFLTVDRWEAESRHFQRNPAWHTGEAIFGVFSLLLREFAPFEERLPSIEKRLDAIPPFLERARSAVENAPAAWRERAVEECRGALAFFDQGLAHIPHAGRLDAVSEAARDAFALHLTYLQSLPESTEVAAGEGAFEMLLREAHALSWSPSELSSLARDELARSRDALEAKGDWRQELDELTELHPTVDRYYQSYTDCWEASRRFAVENRLVTWPEFPIAYVPQPEWARAAAPSLYFLFYRSPATFDRQAGVDYLVTPVDEGILRANNDSVIKLNHVVHHGGIGHHVQNWHAIRCSSRIGQVAAVDCASRIAMLLGGTMAEGWACYATDLMDEAGFLTPLESFSQHHARVRMAARAVVDAELHGEAMSFEQAEAFYVEQTAMSPAAARKEVTKNSMFPGAAVIYFAGTKLIHELRAEIAGREQDRFDLRAFHDRFLSHGSIPVARIRELMLE